MPRRYPLPDDDGLLTVKEVAERLRMHETDVWRLATTSPALLAGKRRRGHRTWFLKSAVVRYLHTEAQFEPCVESNLTRAREEVPS